MNGSGQSIYRLGEIEVDPAQGCLKRDNQELHLRQKTFQVLLYLLQQRPRLVTKEELMASIWADTAVTDDALVQCIVDIRKALGDDPRQSRFVKTIPKIGYRFIGPVEEIRLDEPGAIEVEEFTSVEIKIEDEIINHTRPAEVTPKPLPARQRQPWFHRRVLWAVVSVVALGIASSVYVGQRSWFSKSPQTDVRLPHVPGKKPLVVMYFENQSGSRPLDWLREGLADMLITDLSRSKKLTVLSRQQLHLLLERMGREEAGRIRLDDALEVARRSQAEAIVLGSFAGLGDKVRIDVQLHDARTGQMLAAESLIVDRPDQILTQVDLLSLKLASHLGVAPTGQDEKSGLAEVMTDNLEAYRYYSLAVEKAQAYHNADALALLAKATALDPEFAMAHARMGYIYAVTWGLAEQAEPYLEKAFRLSRRLTEKDRLYITAWYAIAHRDYAAAIPPLQTIIANDPLEIEAYQRLGHLLRGEERFDEAINVWRQGLVMDPDAKDIYNALGGLYSNLNRHGEAIASHQRYVELAPQEPNAHDSLALSYQWAGQYDRALEEYQRALALNPDFEIAVVNLGNLYFQMGRYRAAIGQYQRYLHMARSDMEREKGYGCLAWVYLKQGKLNQAAAAAQKELQYGQASSVGTSLMIALKRGHLAAAQKWKERLSAASPYTHRGARPPLRAHYFSLGSFALQRGRVEEAMAHFKEALKHLPQLGGMEYGEDCLANAYLELDRLDEAIAEYQRILRLNPNYPLAHYHLGQAYERKGRRAQAQAAYERFLHIWKDADPDILEVSMPGDDWPSGLRWHTLQEKRDQAASLIAHAGQVDPDELQRLLDKE